jgi:hypothetical protein
LGNVPIQPLNFFILTTTFSKKLCEENWNEKSDYDFRAFFFVVMAPRVYRTRGVATAAGVEAF